ncbi:hypothetical protein NA56DRAFT_641278 [Hyaloscypha hepaticicola]|uniref:Uncharacterized protein n=1 Tax=Hyaloscypha hepaticicola TaxID=2082293 RepID=A0A2J6QJY1_9HELO|nr:hypothetical protein NA56DRAFT_641278 [Hyaloscypha hepaticicola]
MIHLSKITPGFCSPAPLILTASARGQVGKSSKAHRCGIPAPTPFTDFSKYCHTRQKAKMARIHNQRSPAPTQTWVSQLQQFGPHFKNSSAGPSRQHHKKIQSIQIIDFKFRPDFDVST